MILFQCNPPELFTVKIDDPEDVVAYRAARASRNATANEKFRNDVEGLICEYVARMQQRIVTGTRILFSR